MTMRRNHNPRAAQRAAGFTLLEMIIVVAIIGLLAALVMPRLVGQLGESKVKTTRAQIELLHGAVVQYITDVGQPPPENEGLDALITRPADVDEEDWNGPYLEKDAVPRDAWGNAFVYELPDEGSRYVIRSLGADGKPGGTGDAADLDNRSA